MEFTSFTNFFAVLWSGQINETRLLLFTSREGLTIPTVNMHSVITMKKDRSRMYCCHQEDLYQVC